VGALWARLTRPIWLTGRVANSLRLADSDYANKEILTVQMVTVPYMIM
jgi:hypothetical protein